MEYRLYGFLARHRATPQSSTGQTPSELVLKTPPRTRLDLLRPCVHNLVLQKQAYEKQRHDAHTVDRMFIAGDRYWVLNCQGNPSKWIPTVIENQLGPLTFIVRLCDGRLWKRHTNYLRQRRSD